MATPPGGRQVADREERAPSEARPNLEVLAGSHNVSIGSFTATTVGRDLNFQYHINSFNAPPSNEKDSIQAQREAILECLNAPHFHAVYSSAFEQRMDGTGVWLLELPEFKKFMGLKGATLWCTGMPGSGKTVLASIAVDHIQTTTEESPHSAIAFAFLRYSEPYTWREILTSLLIQLIRGNDTACASFWISYSRAAGKMAPEVIIPVSDMEAAIRAIAQSLEILYMVIDGLDEASDQVKDRLLEILGSSGVNLLILSRPLDLYTRYAPDAFFVSIQAQTEDIDLYVRDAIQRSSRLQALLGDRPDRISELCEKITRQSEGMFLVAKLQMVAISRSSRSISRLFGALEALPAGINAMYDHTLSRIRDSEDASIAFRVFAWLLCANPDSLSPLCLQHALSFDPETMTFDNDDITPVPLILSACQGLVTVADDAVRFIHYTTQEYMKTAELDGVFDPHSLLAATCIACMEVHREYLLYLCAIHDQGGIFSYLSGQPLLKYSHDRWHKHVSSSLPPTSPHFDTPHPFLSMHEEYPSFLPPDGSVVPGSMEMVGGVHLFAMYDIAGAFDLTKAQSLLPSMQSEPGGYTPFHLAAMNGRFEAFLSLSTWLSGANIRSADGSTVLHVAVRYRQRLFIQKLHDLVYSSQQQSLGSEDAVFDFDVNAQNSHGRTPLMLASELGEGEIVDIFVSCDGVDGNIQDDKGKSAVHYATSYHYYGDAARYYPSIVGSYNNDQQSSLTKILCSIPHININIRDKEGITPFLSACRAGLEEVVKYLLAIFEGDPPFVHQTNEQEQTALMLVYCAMGEGWECDLGRQQALLVISNLLVDHGSDLHARDVHGMTPFLWVMKDPYPGPFTIPPGDWEKVSEWLLSLDPTLIDQLDHHGRTALMIAVCDSGDEGLANWVLARKNHDIEFINAQDNDGTTAFLHACHAGAPKVVEALLALPCVDIYQRCGRGLSALDWLFRIYYNTKGVRVLQVLKQAGDWGMSDIRKVFLRALSREHDQKGWLEGNEFLDLWTLTSDAFVWDLDHTDTILLLTFASLKHCRVYVALVLISLGLLPMSSFDFGREGMGICVDRPEKRFDFHFHSREPFHAHESFQPGLRELFPGQEKEDTDDNESGEGYTHIRPV